MWGKSVGQKLIVVADDDPACRGLMAEILTDAGYACVEAECGRSALALIDLRPDLLLTDLFMPDLDGIEIILKAKQTWPGVRIAAISGGHRRLRPHGAAAHGRHPGGRRGSTQALLG